MTSNVIDATAIFEKAATNAFLDFAQKFVDIYINASPHAAGLYATSVIGEDGYSKVAPYVEEEFNKRGYEIVPSEE